MSKSIYPNSIKNCLNCQSEIPKQNKFCNRSCAASYNNLHRSKESREKQAKSVSITMKKQVELGIHFNPIPKGTLLVTREERSCKQCHNVFMVKPSSKKRYCSVTCGFQHPGGYREGSGRAKTGYYQGYYCGSTYELAWIIYQLDHQNQFERFPGYLTDGKLTYYPDFLLPNNHIIEIKGYHTDAVDKKCKLAENNGYTIDVLYRDDLREIFNYVSNKFNVKPLKFYTLYE